MGSNPGRKLGFENLKSIDQKIEPLFRNRFFSGSNRIDIDLPREWLQMKDTKTVLLFNYSQLQRTLKAFRWGAKILRRQRIEKKNRKDRVKMGKREREE